MEVIRYLHEIDLVSSSGSSMTAIPQGAVHIYLPWSYYRRGRDHRDRLGKRETPSKDSCARAHPADVYRTHG